MLNSLFGSGRERDSKRTLGERDRQILWIRATKRCENPACGKKIEYIDMEVGHKTAWSKGGRTTLANSKCLCPSCNKRQGNDSWAVFLKKQGTEDPDKLLKSNMKASLNKLSISQLKTLAAKHNIKLKGKVVEEFFSSHTVAPTKKQYIDKLSIIVTEKEIKALPKETPKPATKRKKKSNDSWF